MRNAVALAVAGARAALGIAGEMRGDGEPRFELFHAANSICSQKVRAVLEHHRLPYVSHTLDLFAGQTYLPGYVRLRMLGCERYGGALAAHHDGSTVASGGGCDGAVVPTLIDWRTGEVVVDSKRICLHLDGVMPADEQLRRGDLSVAIDADLAIVDNLPNYQMLMGRSIGAKATTGAGFSERKVAWCTAYLEQHRDDPVLVAAYTAKRAKELSAATALFSPEAMQAAYARAEAALVALERTLAGRGTRWLHRDTVTMADLFWGVELLRMRNVGVAHMWEDGRLPHVTRLLDAAEQLPAIRTAIVEWPGALF